MAKSTYALPRFRSDVEERFRREQIAFSLPIYRVAWILAAALYTAFFLWDLSQIEANLVVAFSVRFAFSVVMIGVIALSFTDGFLRYAHRLLLFVVCLAALGLLVILRTQPDGFIVGVGGILLVVMYGTMFFVIGFRSALTFSLVTLLMTNGFVLSRQHDPYSQLQVLVNVNFIVGSGAVVGCLFAYFIEYWSRVSFGQTGSIPEVMPRNPELLELDEGGTRVFICYRRNDSADVTGRIADKLVSSLGAANIVIDVDNVPLGADFRAHLGRQIRSCDAMLAIIGASWLGEPGTRSRLLDDRDPVRTEIELAMNLGLIVIPVLVQHAEMPVPEALPPSIAHLCYLNAARVRPDPDFHSDTERLLAQLDSCRRM